MHATDISISDCSDGDVLACDVYNNRGVKLVSRDITVNFYIRKHLYEQGVEYVKIYTPEKQDGKRRSGKFINMVDYYRRSALCIKSLVTELASGNPLDFEKIAYISDMIFQYVDESENILRLIDDIRKNDEETYSHSINTAFYCMLLAKWLQFTDKEVKTAVQSGFLHDIGKSKVPPEILNKTSRLTSREFERIKKHPIYGYYILDENRFPDLEVKRAVLLHHERLNKTGYPFNISPDSIDRFARIVAVADVYDAMTSNRVYKKSVSPFGAFEMFLSEGKSLFDPYLMREFLNHLSSYFIGSKVILNTGVSGQIVYIPPDDVLSPIVLVNDEYLNLSRNKNLKIERTLN